MEIVPVPTNDILANNTKQSKEGFFFTPIAHFKFFKT